MTVGELLREAAADACEATALVEGVARPADRRRWTYAELLEQAERTARALLGRFEPGERVAVWANNIPRMGPARTRRGTGRDHARHREPGAARGRADPCARPVAGERDLPGPAVPRHAHG